MARIYLCPLFVLLIVIPLSLDFNEATDDFPGRDYIDRCLFDAEVEYNEGIYRYDPEESITYGRPKMVKLDIAFGEPIDYNKVDKRYTFSYKSIAGFYELRFPFASMRLDIGSKHPCLKSSQGTTYWNIYHGGLFPYFAGVGQVTNSLVNFDCIPEKGRLSSDIRYDLPTYRPYPYAYRTVYMCVTFLRNMEEDQGLKSNATAAMLDVNTWECEFFYSDHSDIDIDEGVDDFYCLLKETVSPGEYPGFYRGCKIYVEHPVFAGLWELNYVKHSNWMPYLMLRNTEFSEDHPHRIILKRGFDTRYKARLSNERLWFLLDGIILFEVAMKAHFCIGPDHGQEVTRKVSRETYRVYRYDNGLLCIPVYGDYRLTWYSWKGQSINLRHANLNQEYTLTNCAYQAFTVSSSLWVIAVNTHDRGPCMLYNYSSSYVFKKYDTTGAYSCFKYLQEGEEVDETAHRSSLNWDDG